jgi:hypothetical protein
VSFDLQDVVNDPDLAEPFTVLRQNGSFVQGGWQVNAPQSIEMWGVVTVASNKELQMLSEADRVRGARMFFSQAPIYVTNEADGITSDIIVWNGLNWRVMSVGQYQNRGGYYCAIAQRMRGN